MSHPAIGLPRSRSPKLLQISAEIALILKFRLLTTCVLSGEMLWRVSSFHIDNVSPSKTSTPRRPAFPKGVRIPIERYELVYIRGC
ncbi:hypothetical protein M407DRAFT_151386 [Tulasnella calospora MUT 4182]|uniref:Uncharacterized protein n=1 Tax=Tulasnella calospora MUT 4182 TaxID=1051891 RepID=A0A0C3QMI1_9AGAM|nr:hypothetical protein M407DRAFT_151386 [Tulasnella calospora MUT 4182]